MALLQAGANVCSYRQSVKTSIRYACRRLPDRPPRLRRFGPAKPNEPTLCECGTLTTTTIATTPPSVTSHPPYDSAQASPTSESKQLASELNQVAPIKVGLELVDALCHNSCTTGIIELFGLADLLQDSVKGSLVHPLRELNSQRRRED